MFHSTHQPFLGDVPIWTPRDWSEKPQRPSCVGGMLARMWIFLWLTLQPYRKVFFGSWPRTESHWSRMFFFFVLKVQLYGWKLRNPIPSTGGSLRSFIDPIKIGMGIKIAILRYNQIWICSGWDVWLKIPCFSSLVGTTQTVGGSWPVAGHRL